MPLRKGEPIVLYPYDPEWPTIFERLRRVLCRQVGELALSIEHVGSTSIPGLSAKPIIDLIIVIESREYLPDIVKKLAELGYAHKGDGGITGREGFRRADAQVPYDGETDCWLDHHLYVCAQDAQELKRQLTFRNYLRENTDATQAYYELKRELEMCYRNDRPAYCEGKTVFVNGILAIANKT